MKLKLLGLACLSLLCLASCSGGDNGGATNTTTTTTTATTAQYSGLLNFLEEGKARIEVHDLDVNISYGNEAITAPYKIVTISNNAVFSVNKNTTNNDSYYFTVYADNSAGHHTQVYKAIEGDQLLEFYNLIKNEISGYTRAFVSISKSSAQWTHGLNAGLDDEIERFLNSTD